MHRRARRAATAQIETLGGPLIAQAVAPLASCLWVGRSRVLSKQRFTDSATKEVCGTGPVVHRGRGRLAPAKRAAIAASTSALGFDRLQSNSTVGDRDYRAVDGNV